jgi:hypothetical protein
LFGAKILKSGARSVHWLEAARNSEDLNVVTSPEVAAAYAAHWQARQAVSVRFADASQWCERMNPDQPTLGTASHRRQQ